MNAVTQTVADLVGFLSKLSNDEPRIGDFLTEQPTFSAACFLANLARSKPVSEALIALDRRIAVEERKRTVGHWSFSMNRLIAFRQLRAALASTRRDGPVLREGV